MICWALAVATSPRRERERRVVVVDVRRGDIVRLKEWMDEMERGRWVSGE